MDERTVARVTDWDSRPLSAGLRDLHRLADDGFSGAVDAGGTWVFMLNGRAVGVFDGSIDAIGDAEGTVYRAPDPGVVLLTAMREEGGETQASYYTNDTPLSEVNDTLSDGSFTGYVELSENVLSGDYYVAYYGGRALPVAYVGQAETLHTGDEAFERAADEVGIYEVVKVPIEVADLPPLPDDASAGAGAAGAAGAAAGAAATDAGSEPDADAAGEDPTPAPADPEQSDEPAEEEPTAGTESDEPSPGAGPDPSAADEAADPPEDAAPSADDGAGADESTDDAGATGGETDAESSAAEPSAAASTEATETPAEDDEVREPEDAADPTPETPARDPAESDEPDAGTDETPATESERPPGTGTEDVFSEEQEWRETTTIPALSPDETPSSGPAAGATEAPPEEETATTTSDPSPSEQTTERTAQTTTETRSSGTTDRQQSPDEARELRERVENLQRALDEREDELAAARERAETAESERDDLRDEVERLESRIESLKDDLADARTAASVGGEVTETEGPSLTPGDALAGTNLFVRYASKGQPTLEDVPDGADATEVNANLRLDHHTTFDAEEATVGGTPYEEYLESTPEYAFVNWLVSDLPYEIRDAGHEEGLADLYGALQHVDRAQLRGTVTVSPDGEDAEEQSEEFDVVLRDRMGTPLVVANLNEERDPVTGDMMEYLVSAGEKVGSGGTDLAAGFYVTSSFFRPEALERAEEATGGGFLSRSSKESFVRTGRKEGFHLLLVEQRNGSFYVNVPEL